MKKIFFAAILSSFALFNASGFGWPQEETEADSFYSYFGQLRGNTINSSLVFKDNSTIRASDDGEMSVIIEEHGDDFGWFESSLGNAVIITHGKDLSAVYANLEEGTIPEEIKYVHHIEKDTVLGTSGNSGWQEGQSCLEFKVYDSKNKAAVNPRILLPRLGKELSLPIGTLSLYDKKGVAHAFSEKYFPSGVYTLYRTRSTPAMPFKTTVLINGATVEKIDYDMIHENKGTLGVTGNTHYNSAMLYPDNNKHLLGTINLIKGHNTVSVILTNILGQTNSVTYNIDCY